MKKIECIIRPANLEAVVMKAEALEVKGLNITQIVGYGGQRGGTNTYRGVEYDIKLKEKLKVEMVVSDALVESVIDAVVDVTRTDTVGDGKIFVYAIEDAIRIRTGERGEAAL